MNRESEWNEQWKTDGDCVQCRRYRYCSTPCKPFKVKRQKAMLALMQKLLNNEEISEEAEDENTD